MGWSTAAEIASYRRIDISKDGEILLQKSGRDQVDGEEQCGDSLRKGGDPRSEGQAA